MEGGVINADYSIARGTRCSAAVSNLLLPPGGGIMVGRLRVFTVSSNNAFTNHSGSEARKSS